MAKQKAQIRLIRITSLPGDVRLAIIAAKRSIRSRLPGQNQIFYNRPPVLPNPDDGCQYFEFDVGEARPDDPLGERGKRRLVIEVITKPRQIREIYFTDSHYHSGTFRRLV